MIKLVNGTPVDIPNIDVFEKAIEGLAIGRSISNTIPEKSLELDQETLGIIDKYIEAYKRFRSSLPYPLYGLDTDVMYCAAGTYIVNYTGINNTFWVDNGLYVVVNESNRLALGFVNETWGIVFKDNIPDKSSYIGDYREELGFKEIVWCGGQILKGVGTSDYYKKFMPNFMKACNNQPIVMKWELGSILEFNSVPNKINLIDNKVIDITKKCEYTLDIFTSGKRPTKTMTYSFDFTKGDDGTFEEKHKYKRVFGYELYKKDIDTDDVEPGNDKVKHIELYGINSLFCMLCIIRNSSSSNQFEKFRGVICGNNFVFVINNRVFVAAADTYVEAKEIGRNVDIYAIDENVVYFIKSTKVYPGVVKEKIYSYNLDDSKLRICKIQYVRN